MKVKDVVVDMHQGINTVADKVEYLEEGIPIIQSKNFTRGFLDLEDVRFLGKEDEEKYIEKYNPHIGDILMANIGTIGKSFVISEEQRFLIAWNAFLIKPNHEKVQSDFLKFYFDYLAENHFFDKLLTGGTVKFINKTKIGDINLPDKSLNEQNEICIRLSKMEQIIIKRQMQLELLDCLIKSRFVEMFIGKGYPERTVHDVLTTAFWLMPATPDFIDDGDVPYITSKNIKNRSIDFENVKYISHEAFETISSNRPTQIGDILVSMIGTLGQTAVISDDREFYGQNLYLLRLDNSVVDTEYFCEFFNSESAQHELHSKRNQSTQAYLKANHVEDLILPLAPMDQQKAFSAFVKQVDKSKVVVQKALNEAQTLFNSLMQECFE